MLANCLTQVEMWARLIKQKGDIQYLQKALTSPILLYEWGNVDRRVHCTFGHQTEEHFIALPVTLGLWHWSMSNDVICPPWHLLEWAVDLKSFGLTLVCRVCMFFLARFFPRGQRCETYFGHIAIECAIATYWIIPPIYSPNRLSYKLMNELVLKPELGTLLHNFRSGISHFSPKWRQCAAILLY